MFNFLRKQLNDFNESHKRAINTNSIVGAVERTMREKQSNIERRFK